MFNFISDMCCSEQSVLKFCLGFVISGNPFLVCFNNNAKGFSGLLFLMEIFSQVKLQNDLVVLRVIRTILWIRYKEVVKNHAVREHA